jgi:uncharacterized protein (TIGR03435 family)
MSTRLTATVPGCTTSVWTDVMVRSVLAVSLAMAPSIQPRVTAQTAPPPSEPSSTFEVASIKPNNSGDNGVFFTYLGGRFTATNATLRILIRSAYGVQDSQIVGGPKWMNSDRFNILAKGDVGQSPAPLVIQPGGPSRLQLMMQALLADRFKLVVHTESKDSNVYALVLARSDGRLGQSLRHSEVDCAALASEARRTGAPAQAAPPAQAQANPCALSRGAGSINMVGRPLSQLANSLSNILGRPVVDQTGLTGTFDINLTWTPEQTASASSPTTEASAAPADGPPIFTAIREQLGLKLVSQKSAAEVLVVDRAEHPVEN